VASVVLIPAYEPDTKLLTLLRSLRDAQPDDRVVVVNDGSGTAYQPMFAAAADLGAEVVTHPHNRGKGAALKTGFAHIAEHYGDAVVVCADCDGQHTAADIGRIAAAVQRSGEAMVLGVRDFAGHVPTKNRFGNTVTRYLFSSATGTQLCDTQTGLRGYPASLLPWLSRVSGDRFDYELKLLLLAPATGYPIVEVPTSTIYLDGNASSHFRPVVDSARVYAPLVRFGCSSIVAFLIDAIGLVVIAGLTGNLLLAVAGARITSATVNFVTNRRQVFRAHGHGTVTSSAVRYGLLVLVILTCNYGLMRLLVTDLGLPLLVAKAATELLLFTFSYQVQRRWIFDDSASDRDREPTNRTAVMAAAHLARNSSDASTS
jgi:glycosyltransferase involved in cell wall biosynthesis